MDFIYFPTDEPIQLPDLDIESAFAQLPIIDEPTIQWNEAGMIWGVYPYNDEWPRLHNMPQVSIPQIYRDVPLMTRSANRGTSFQFEEENRSSDYHASNTLPRRSNSPPSISGSSNPQLHQQGRNNPGNSETINITGHLPFVWYNLDTEYSQKVFVGGLPRSVTEQDLDRVFRPYGPIIARDIVNRTHRSSSASVIFQTRELLMAFLSRCTRTKNHFLFKTRFIGFKPQKVLIYPWAVADSSYPQGMGSSSHVNTVFVGGLHGSMTAMMLSALMSDLFGDVEHTELCTDIFDFPRGFARVRFSNVSSYLRAVSAERVVLTTQWFKKTIDICRFKHSLPCATCKQLKGPDHCISCQDRSH